MQARLICLIACLALSACTASSNTHSNYTLYLVRHAEKAANGSNDPDLTLAGKARAIELANRLQHEGIRAIWSSDYQRTRDTATPLAKQLGLQVKMYDPDEPGKLQAQLQERHENALVVGHSNTVPELARLLCNCEVAGMQETEYDRLILIRVRNDKAELQTLTQ